jgi:hypothetical protein
VVKVLYVCLGIVAALFFAFVSLVVIADCELTHDLANPAAVVQTNQ